MYSIIMNILMICNQEPANNLVFPAGSVWCPHGDGFVLCVKSWNLKAHETKIYKIINLKHNFKKNIQKNITCMEYTSVGFIAGTFRGEIVVFSENFEVIKESKKTIESEILSIVEIKKGEFLVLCKSKKIYLYKTIDNSIEVYLDSDFVIYADKLKYNKPNELIHAIGPHTITCIDLKTKKMIYTLPSPISLEDFGYDKDGVNFNVIYGDTVVFDFNLKIPRGIGTFNCKTGMLILMQNSNIDGRPISIVPIGGTKAAFVSEKDCHFEYGIIKLYQKGEVVDFDKNDRITVLGRIGNNGGKIKSHSVFIYYNQKENFIFKIGRNLYNQ